MPAAAGKKDHCGGFAVKFEFMENVQDAGICSSVPPVQQREFETHFCAQAVKVKRWFSDNGWISANSNPLPRPVGGTYAPRTDLQVFVSSEFDLSRSLVPAWCAQRGRMEFPSGEAVANEAAIAHELTHVLFPNGNRLLAEGLAVYVQQVVGINPAFPNFGHDLHQLVKDFTCEEDIDLTKTGHSFSAMDRIATPVELSVRIGLPLYSDAVNTYPIAGSFVQYLLENYGAPAHRMRKFRELYLKTPLVPLEREPGELDRWKDVYGAKLDDILSEWKSFIQGMKCSN